MSRRRAALLARRLRWCGCVTRAAALLARPATRSGRAYVMPDPATSTLPFTSSAVPYAHWRENDKPAPFDMHVPSARRSYGTLAPVQSNDNRK